MQFLTSSTTARAGSATTQDIVDIERKREPKKNLRKRKITIKTLCELCHGVLITQTTMYERLALTHRRLPVAIACVHTQLNTTLLWLWASMRVEGLRNWNFGKTVTKNHKWSVPSFGWEYGNEKKFSFGAIPNTVCQWMKTNNVRHCLRLILCRIFFGDTNAA